MVTVHHVFAARLTAIHARGVRSDDDVAAGPHGYVSTTTGCPHFDWTNGATRRSDGAPAIPANEEADNAAKRAAQAVRWAGLISMMVT